MAYPTTLDDFTVQAAGEEILANDINELQTAIEAIEAKVGVTSSAVSTSIDYKLVNTSSISPGHKHSSTRELPLWVFWDAPGASAPSRPGFPDEDANNRVRVHIPVPSEWDGTTDITLKTIWTATSTGLADLETQIVYGVETAESSFTTVQAFTNSNITWAGANTNNTLTTTISAANVAAGRFEVTFRRNTGDANTGVVILVQAVATTGVRIP